KIARLVRDISKKSGKPIQCIIQGEETELDKTIVDKIGEPLLHIIRNALDHGIEGSSDQRLAKGKPAQGSLNIKAFHKSGNIHIEIEDDGRGLDKGSILKKAKDLKLVMDDVSLSERDIVNLIFEPGFSTASEITDLSGRGVGMSVVKTTIEALRGQVDVRSVEGKGCTFIIKIPLTLAIIDGMIVRTGENRFIIPTLSIITSSKIEPGSISTVINKGKMVDVQGHLIPLFKLSSLLETHDSAQADSPLMVVVEGSNRRIALGVDELIGKQQIVIKSLGESLKNTPGISGAAIMPDGKVGLIVDIDKLTGNSHIN
ncbi:MAG: chemotaxis protein CheW, partial [Proteobacteria bacterium]|nr:chemotaxis protein CheW [Pseudomonadota bacterium]